MALRGGSASGAGFEDNPNQQEGKNRPAQAEAGLQAGSNFLPRSAKWLDCCCYDRRNMLADWIYDSRLTGPGPCQKPGRIGCAGNGGAALVCRVRRANSVNLPAYLRIFFTNDCAGLQNACRLLLVHKYTRSVGDRRVEATAFLALLTRISHFAAEFYRSRLPAVTIPAPPIGFGHCHYPSNQSHSL